MLNIRAPLYQGHQIKEFERIATERFNISAEVMMQRAGKAAFDLILRRWPQVQTVSVFCGGGNNGGDGYVIARLLAERGLKVNVWQVGNFDKLSPEASHAKNACEHANVRIKSFDAQSDLSHADLIVDAICGIGLHTPLRDEAVNAIKKIQQFQAPILAIDVPTGIDADTGQIQGIALRANVTITFIGVKVGLLTGSGCSYSGEIALNELQFPTEIYQSINPVAERIILNGYSKYLKPRLRDWHKGLSGHVLVVGGALGFSGAPRMAAEAALRVGAGLVSVATTIENAPLINIDRPEIMAHGVKHASDLQPLLKRADVIVVGPGLGQSEWAKDLLGNILKSQLPLIVDADALNLIAQTPVKYDNWILTPHPGEASRLLHVDTVTIQADRLAASQAIQKKYGGVNVLKGAGTIVSTPSGLPAICDKGNPGMASAGMGDILSGVLGGLVAQKIPLNDAAKLGVYIHGQAGDLAAKDGERGMVAMDLMPYLRRLANLS